MAERLEELRRLPWGAGSGVHRERAEPGVVFAAQVGPLRYWRFVPLLDGNTDPSFLGGLQRARCVDGEPRLLPEDVRPRLFALWERARADMHAEHQRLCDPAERAAAVAPAQREAVALLFRADVDGAEAALAALQVPWPRTVSTGLRRILAQLGEGAGEAEVAGRLVEFVRSEGLRGPTPEELPRPIRLEDIHLVCYQYVGPAAAPPTDARPGAPLEQALRRGLGRPQPLRMP